MDSSRKFIESSFMRAFSKATRSLIADPFFSIWRSISFVIIAGVMTATVLTMWTPANLINADFINSFQVSAEDEPENNTLYIPTPTSLPTPRIGIISGHWKSDPGSVCADGLTENEVNLRIATLVRQYLLEDGEYVVDLIPEYGEQLNGYEARLLISIHNDTCDYIENGTGFKVAADTETRYPDKSLRLKACLVHRYQEATGLTYHYYTISEHMRGYHAFNRITDVTPAAIIEAGFLNLDRELLEKNPELIARGIADGVLCYLNNEPVPIQEILPDENIP